MKFTATELEGAYLIEPVPHEDERGFFARMICTEEFKPYGLKNDWPQQNIAYNPHKGTLRGMHYQLGDAAEIKLIRVTSGTIYDVIIDIRPTSPTYQKWQGFTLSSDNRHQLYIPAGFAHGYITLTDDAELSYLVSTPYTPNMERGVRYNDPFFSIAWPLEPTRISPKDSSWADYAP